MSHPAEAVLDPPLAPPRSAAELIALILRRYHEVHLAELPKLIAQARVVEAVHSGRPDVPAGLADHLCVMTDELCGHQRKEEQVLFPMMLEGGHPMIAHPIARMTAEHRDVEEQLQRLAALTRNFSPPEDACESWRRLYAGCRKFADDLVEHMRLENEELFPGFL